MILRDINYFKRENDFKREIRKEKDNEENMNTLYGSTVRYLLCIDQK